MTRKQKILAGAVSAFAFAVITAGGAMVYAQRDTTSSNTFLDRVAQVAGVDSTTLKNAFKQVSKEYIDQRVEDGKLTEDQATRIKERIDSGEFRGAGMGVGAYRGQNGLMLGRDNGVAEFLGMTQDELRTAHETQTLVQIAKEKGKTEEELKKYLTKTFTENLSKAVDEGKITQAQADDMKSRFEERLSDMINNVRPERPKGGVRMGRGMMEN